MVFARPNSSNAGIPRPRVGCSRSQGIARCRAISTRLALAASRLRKTTKVLPGALAVVLCLLTCCALAQGVASDNSRLPRDYREAKSAYESQPNDPEAAWKLGRASFDARETASNKVARADMAEQAIAACRRALATHSNSAPLHYYLGLNLGALAQTRGISAVKLVDQMEEELLKARTLDAAFDHAGPDRTLGILYRDAPSIISVGNRAKARRHSLRSVELAPTFPENRLELIQSFVKWNERERARRELALLEQNWAAARTNLTGDQWTANWAEWEDQLQRLKKNLGESAKLETPRR